MAISRELWGRIQKILSDNPELNEANTIGKLIDPILNALGWDITSDEVEREVPIDVGSSSTHVDYALKIEGIPRVFLEIKNLRTELTDRHAKQVLSYASIEKVSWCILTNGRQYRIYNSEWGSDPKDALFCTFELLHIGEIPVELNYLSRDFIEDGRLDENAGKSRVSVRAKSLLIKKLEEIRNETWSKARKLIFEDLKNEIPETSKKDVTDVIMSLLKIDVIDGTKSYSPETTEQVENRKIGAGTKEPWMEDGQSWHLRDRCSPQTAEVLKAMNNSIHETVVDATGPNWNQKYYVSYFVGKNIWLYINTDKNILYLNFKVKPNSFDSSKVAKELGISIYPENGNKSQKIRTPSSVVISRPDRGHQWLTIRVKSDFHPNSDAFIRFLRSAREAFPL